MKKTNAERRKPMPRPCLVDTNVAVVANEKSRQAKAALTLACIDALVELTRSGGLVLDASNLIYDEYRRHLTLRGQPGTGDMFMKWVHDHQWNPELCERRAITPLGNDPRGFAEFPKAAALAHFDASDRKFVAVANAGNPKRPILEAVDFKWWGWKEALAAEGIEVVFIDDNAAEAGYQEHLDNG